MARGTAPFSTTFEPSCSGKCVSRRSRMHRTAGRTKTGQPRTVEPKPRDIAIFDILQRYRYLPSNFIWELIPPSVRGVSYKRYVERLGTLFHEGYVGRPARQWQAVNARYKPCTYELDTKGAALLANHGLRSRHRVGHRKNFAHELLVCLIQASMEITCINHPLLEYVSWQSILTYKSLPEATRTSPSPFKIPVTVDGKKGYLISDGRPAAIWYKHESGKRYPLVFPGFEADCATEPLEPFDIHGRANIEYKLKAYLDMARKRTYRSHFGFPNMFVPFVMTSARRMENSMALLEKLTGGKGTSYMLFTSVPHFASFDSAPQPTDLLLTEPWRRVGHPPFDIVTTLVNAVEKKEAT